MNNEQAVMELIVHAGNARSLAMQTIEEAKNGNFEIIKELNEELNKEFLLAHKMQTEMISKELNGEKSEMSLLMIHAQDHLMNAQTVKDLAEQIVYLIKKVEKLEGEK